MATSPEEIPDFMDLDLVDIPDELFDVNDEFIDVYLKNVRDGDDNSGGRPLLPSFNLDDPLLGQQQQSLPLVSASVATSSGSQAERLPSAPGIPPPDTSIPTPNLRSMSSGAASGLDVKSVPVGGEGEEEDEDEDEEPVSKGKRSSGGRKVTPQRKQNNRKAQQRYREKRKQQAAEREQQVAMLSSQLAAMQSIQHEHAAVSSENVQLREVLLQKEAEIEQLKKTMAEQTSQTMDEHARAHSANNREMTSSEDAPPSEDDVTDLPHGPDRAVAVHVVYKESTEKLKNLTKDMTAMLQAHGLPTDCYAGADAYIKDSLSCKLRPIVVEANKVSIKRLLSAPTCPIERSSCNSRRFSMVNPCSMFRTHWMNIIERLQLDNGQIEALLTARTKALEQLRVIYEERSALNQMTMAIMLPPPTPQAMYNGTTNHKLKEMERYGSKGALSHSQTLEDALDRIRQSLKSEQKIFVGLHDMLVLKVLSPPQAALMFILDSDGWIVEPLQISNMLALSRGLIEEPELQEDQAMYEKRVLEIRQEWARHDWGASKTVVSEGTYSSMPAYAEPPAQSTGS